MHVGKEFAHGAPFAIGRFACQCLVRDRVDEVERNPVVNFPGLDKLVDLTPSRQSRIANAWDEDKPLFDQGTAALSHP